jgi:Methylamine utilisation protein MauE
MDALGHELAAILSVAGRTCVGLVFLLAATQKSRHWKILFGVIANYRLLPRVSVAPAAVLLPPLEMFVAILLLAAQAMPWAEFAAIGLLALFAAAMAVNIRRGRGDIDCGCGQSFLKQTLSWSLVARNAVLCALLLPSLILTGPMSMSAALTGVGAGLGFFLLYLLLNTLSALPRPQTPSPRFA